MTYFFIYCFALWPVFLALFIHYHRKLHDVTSGDLTGMVVISLIPFMRELIVGSMFLEDSDGVIFRKYK